MKAIQINGQIKIYNKLPKSWGKVIGGFNLLSNDELKSYGFYSVIVDDYDSRVEKLGDIYFDANNEVFKKDVEDITWNETLAELKARQIEVIKDQVKNELQKTDWYIVRNQELGTAIPEDITTQRQSLRDIANSVESEIEAKTTKKAVMSFDFPNLG
jgi:hypothetical protein